MPRAKLEEVVDGIYVEPVPITLGEEVKIKYKGLLANSGASKVFLHAGYGHGEWQKVVEVPMRKTKDGGYSVSLKVDESSLFNFCFRDDADHWDNNSGRNWSYNVHNGDMASH